MIANIFGNFLLFFVFMIGFILGLAAANGVMRAVMTAVSKVFDAPLPSQRDQDK